MACAVHRRRVGRRAVAAHRGRARSRPATELDERLAEWTSTRTKEDAAELLQAHGVSAMPVMGPYDHHADPHLLERGAIVTLHHPEVGDERHIGNPLRFSRLPQRVARARRSWAPTPKRCSRRCSVSTPTRSRELVADGVCR